MSKDRKTKRIALDESNPKERSNGSALIDVDGLIFEAKNVDGVPYITPELYADALRTIEDQKLELESLRASATAVESAADPNDVRKHLRCPLCWGRRRGKAGRRKWQRQVNGPLQKRCYVCDKCGTEWVVEVRSEESDDGFFCRETSVVEVRPGDSLCQ